MNKMINIWLMGGLGNVLFQVNYGRYLRSKGYNVCFIDNLLKKNVITRALGWKIHSPDYRSLNEEFISKNISYTILALVLARSKIGIFSQYASGFFDFEKNLSKNIFCYFQSAKNLQEVDIGIDRAEFGSRELAIPFEPYVAIHRRYSDTGWEQPLLTPILDTLIHSRVLVCTDSQSDAISDLDHYSLTYDFSDGISSIDDFLVLVDSKTLVCSNSTFALWALLIGSHDSVYVPKELAENFPFIRMLGKIIYEF